MASARTIVVDFIGNDRSLGSTAGSVETQMGSLSSKMKSVGAIASKGLAAGIVVAGVAMVKFAQQAAEDQASAAKLATTLKNTTGATSSQVAAVEDWISAQGRAYGVADDDLRPALARLSTSTHDVAESQKLASLAMDISAGTGKSLESVAGALAKAHDGQSGALSRLGVQTKDAAGETLSFDQITKNAAKTFGGQAKTQANTLEGQMGRLKLAMSEAGETIGYAVLPIMTKLATWLTGSLIPASAKLGSVLSDTVGPALQSVGAFLSALGASFQGTGGQMSGLGAIAAQVAGMFRDQMGKLAPQMQAVWGSVQSIVTSALSIIRSVVGLYTKGITALWHVFGSTILTWIRSSLQNVVTVVRGALGIVQGIFKVVSSILRGDWKGAWTGIKQIVSGAKGVIVGIVRQMWNNIRVLFSAAGAAVKALAKITWSGVKAIFSAGISAVVSGVRALPGKLRALGSDFLGAGRHLIESFVRGMKNAGGIISGIAGNVWSAVKRLINSAIGRLNAALSFNINLPGPDIHVSTHIPYLAKGTRNFRGGLAVVGEEGPELVNLPRGSRVTPNRESMGQIRPLPMMGHGGGGDTIIVNISAPIYGIDHLAQAIETSFAKAKRRRGTSLAFQG